MSEDPLAPLTAPLTSLPGVGPTVARLIARVAGGEQLRHLLFLLPNDYIDRRARPSLACAQPGKVGTFAVEVVRHEKPSAPRQPWRVTVTDGSGFADIVLFQPHRLGLMPPKAKLLVSGKVESFLGRPTLPHPDHILPLAQASALPAIEPVWPLTAGLWPGQLRRAMAAALAHLPELPEWHDPVLLRRRRWPGFAAALRAVQAPASPPEETARERLAYDEILAGQVAFAMIRSRPRPGRAHFGDGRLREAAMACFGHKLTPAQARVLAEIDADLAAPQRMLRLLQGDVGAGKTLIAVLAMLRAVEAGAQAVLMAPTEVLACQHFRLLERISPVPVALLCGAVKGGERQLRLAGLAEGKIPLAVGTHALFQKTVAFRDLGLAVIDEQHRFGVWQRLALGAKGKLADVLVMTATPIPRTLLLAAWGEMDVSRLAGNRRRRRVRTTLHALANLPEVIAGVGRALVGGAHIYWVCPQVVESELSDIAAAEARFASLAARFGALVALAHGRQDRARRDAALAAFAGGTVRLLVATTVVEVGVDVPEASVMVVEQAERFGLAQLHQLRGRIGRNGVESFCLLLHADDLSAAARRRLTLLRDTEDGFAIADADFRLRGGGDLLGTRQSGEPGWRLANLLVHERLLPMARRDAALLIEKDPELTGRRGQAVRLLLRLFEQERAMPTLHAG